jgi:Spy/CpxP family protein refolding chaperone
MKNVILAAAAGLALVAGAAVVEAQRADEDRDRGAVAGDQGRVGPGFGWRGMFAHAPRQGGRGPGGFAQAPGRGPGRGGPGRGGPGWFGGPMLAALDLTDDQRTKVQAIHRSGREAGGPISGELVVAQRALQRATFAESRDDAEITKLTSTIANLDKQLLDLRVKTDIEVAAVLTPEQREKVRTAEGRGRGRAGSSQK